MRKVINEEDIRKATKEEKCKMMIGGMQKDESNKA